MRALYFLLDSHLPRPPPARERDDKPVMLAPQMDAVRPADRVVAVALCRPSQRTEVAFAHVARLWRPVACYASLCARSTVSRGLLFPSSRGLLGGSRTAARVT